MALRVGMASDRGQRREQNQDRCAVWTPESAAERERRGTLLVVADGMGGAAAGDVASRLAVEAVVETWRAAGALPPLQALRDAVNEANRRVLAEAVREPSRRGMGTTLTVAVVRGAEVTLAHVGDSRAYLIGAGAARVLTRDHTLVAQLVQMGQLTTEQAKVDPRRNVVTRCIGVGDTVMVDAEEWGAVLEPGSALVLCSDGLHGVVDDAEIAREALGAEPEQACQALIEAANRAGGPDNITVVVARPEAATAVARSSAPPPAAMDPGSPAPVVPDARAPLPLARVLLLLGLGVLLAAVVWLATRVAH